MFRALAQAQSKSTKYALVALKIQLGKSTFICIQENSLRFILAKYDRSAILKKAVFSVTITVILMIESFLIY